MAPEGYVSLSRQKLGPEPDPIPASQHRRRHVERDGQKFVAVCTCGWRQKRNHLAAAQEALAEHVLAAES